MNFYISGLKPTVGEMVAHHVWLVPITDSVNQASVKEATVEIGRSKRALFPESSTVDKVKEK